MAASPFEPLERPSGRGRLFVYRDFRPRHLLPRDIFVWVPDAAYTGECFPVLYMQDGQNLFDARLVAFGTAWEADRSMARLGDAGVISPAIIVGIASTADRFIEYAPELILDRLAEPARGAIEDAWGGPVRSAAYARMVMDEIRPLIDAHFPAMTAGATFVGGSSLGAVAAIELLARYPDQIAGAVCLSGHFSLLPVTETELLPDGFAEAVTAAVGSFARASLPSAGRHRLWLDRSALGIDRFYPSSHAALGEALAGLGYVEGVDMALRGYPGVGHDEDAWRSRLDDAFGFVLAAPL